MGSFRSSKSYRDRSQNSGPMPRLFSGIGTLFCSNIVGLIFPEHLDAVKLSEVINASFEPIMEFIHDAQGMILQNIGDTIVAYWDSSHVKPTHQELALQCGRRILAEQKRIPPGVGLSFDIHIFVATGRMTVGLIGGQLQAVGEPWVLVKRMEPFVVQKRSQILYASDVPEHQLIDEFSSAIGRIKRSSGVDIPVFEYTSFP